MRAHDLEIDYELGSPEHLAAAKGDHSNNGPLLRNRSPGHVHSHYWTLVEAIVWVATRDERAVAGAAGYFTSTEDHRLPVDAAMAAKIVLSTDLPIDVAGHHLDCPAMWERAPCECERLGRIRYCTCSYEEQLVDDRICPCTSNAWADVEAAILDGLPVSGRPEGQAAWQAIDGAALAGARRWFDGSGLRFVPGFTDLRLKIDTVKLRWPADFSDKPMRVSRTTPQHNALARLSGVTLTSRPPDWLWGLKIFCDRLDTGSVLPVRKDEAQAVSKLLESQEGRQADEKTVRDWIGPHHRKLVWGGTGFENAGQVAREVVQRISDAVSTKLGGSSGKL